MSYGKSDAGIRFVQLPQGREGIWAGSTCGPQAPEVKTAARRLSSDSARPHEAVGQWPPSRGSSLRAIGDLVLDHRLNGLCAPAEMCKRPRPGSWSLVDEAVTRLRVAPGAGVWEVRDGDDVVYWSPARNLALLHGRQLAERLAPAVLVVEEWDGSELAIRVSD